MRGHGEDEELSTLWLQGAPPFDLGGKEEEGIIGGWEVCLWMGAWELCDGGLARKREAGSTEGHVCTDGHGDNTYLWMAYAPAPV